MNRARPSRTVLLALLGLALFSVVFTLAAWYDRWPRLPPGALHDTDLWAGLAAGVALFVLLLLRRTPTAPDPLSRGVTSRTGAPDPSPFPSSARGGQDANVTGGPPL